MNSTSTSAAIAALAESPLAKQALAERAAVVVQYRRSLLERLEEIETGAPVKRYEAAVRRHEVLKEKALHALDALRAAEQAQAEAETERVNASLAIHMGRDAIVAELEAGANNEAIGSFIAELRVEITKTRKALESREIIVHNSVTGTRSSRIVSNAEKVSARVLAISAAITAAEDLRREADQAIVPDRITALRATIPAPVAPVSSYGKVA